MNQKESFWDRDWKPKNFLEVVIAIFAFGMLGLVWYNAYAVQVNYKQCMTYAPSSCGSICLGANEEVGKTWLEGSEVICGCEYNQYYLRNVTVKMNIKQKPGVILNLTG